MNTTEIKILLEKYYACETSLDEEKILKTYFTSGRVDENLRVHTSIFTCLKNESSIKPADELEDKILEKLHAAARIPFYRNRIFWIYSTGIAASILFIFTFVFEMQNQKTNTLHSNLSHSEKNTKIAYEQTKIALAYVSEKYVRGTEPLSEVAKFSKSTIAVNELVKIGNEINTINHNMNKMGSGVDNLSKLSKFSIIVKP
ncbi:MAG: hypothetical protein K9H16_10520 [Bacteroidales bacterium]|nr:hypothetical protein [Bacteroidales bacterium]